MLLQLADDTATGWVYGAVAVALALMQHAGLHRWVQGYRASALLYFSTWALFTVVSIAASAGALSKESNP